MHTTNYIKKSETLKVKKERKYTVGINRFFNGRKC